MKEERKMRLCEKTKKQTSETNLVEKKRKDANMPNANKEKTK